MSGGHVLRSSPTMLTPPRYNSKDHPVPFHKAQDLGKLPKKLDAGPAPDLEEAYDVSGWVTLRIHNLTSEPE